MNRFFLTFFLLLQMLLPTDSFADSRRVVYKPSDMSQVEFKLWTVGLGPEIYMRYGHSFLKMIDHSSGEEFNFNWGIFDFNDPEFASNYFKGIQIYWMGTSSNESIFTMYKHDEKRKMSEEKLNLTNKQKKILVDRIFWNLRKENRSYLYQHFYNNCSTKIRDYLDEALGGKIKERFGKSISEAKFRDYVVGNLNKPPLIAFSLDIVMNRKIDGPLSQWEEMFYPIRLRELLLDFPQLADDGSALPGTSLLTDSKVLITNPDYPASKTNLFVVFLFVVGLTLVAVLAFMLSSAGAVRNNGYRFLGLLTIFWGVFAGFFGNIMAWSWGFSGHLDILHNANLWLLWPVDILYLFLGIKIFRQKSELRTEGVFALMMSIFTMLHLLAGGAYFVLWASGVFEQNIRNIVLYIWPVHGVLFAVILKYALYTGNKTINSRTGIELAGD